MKNIHDEGLPPGVSKLIGTNAVLSYQQKSIVQDLLVKRRREIITKMRELEAHIKDLEALISPARALIPELIATIFEFCVSTQGKLPSPRPHESPLLLGQICSHWRRIAFSTPKLWRSVLLRLDSSIIPRSSWFSVMEKQALTLECWLARAGSVPIFCHIKYAHTMIFMHDPELSEYADAIRHLVSKLVPHVSRWKNIHLQLPFRCLTPLFDIHQVDAPLLTSLTVTNTVFGSYHPWQHHAFGPPITSAKFPGGARLRQVQIDIPDFLLVRLSLPWAQLEELTMTQGDSRRFDWRSPNANLTLINALDILRRVPNLKRCTLAIDSRHAFALSGAPVSLPKLQKLFIYAQPAQFGLFLQAVIIPRMERLTVYKYWSQPDLLSFLGRANHPIKELSFIRVRNMSDINLFECLQLVPSLKHLQCTSPIGTLVLRGLNPSTLTDDSLLRLCPELDFVEFSCRHPFKDLVEMIEGRCQSSHSVNGVSQLKRARLHLRSKPRKSGRSAEIEARLMKRLQDCADTGLDIVWHL